MTVSVRSMTYDAAEATLAVEFDDTDRTVMTFHGNLLIEPQRPHTGEAVAWDLLMRAVPGGPDRAWGTLRVTRPDDESWWR